MSFLSKLVGGDASNVIEAVGKGIDSVFTSDDERLTHAEVMARIAQEPGALQVEINKIEAGHRSLFVAGWRPFIGWVCGLGLANAFLVTPFLDAYLPGTSVSLPTEIMMEVVVAMLGLGALRTVEKLSGKAK